MNNRLFLIAIIFMMLILFGLLTITSISIRSTYNNQQATDLDRHTNATDWPLSTAISGTMTAKAMTPTPTPKKTATF